MHKVTRRSLFQLLESQDRRCALTGWKLTPDNCALDHIVPLANGGSGGIDNAQLIVRSVNVAKGTMSQEEFIGMCIAVAEHYSSGEV